MKRDQLALLSVALLAAFTLKAYYSRAGADELGWMLRPTASLVSWISGASFEHERAAGYINRELALCIAPACAGINFAIVAFLTLVLSFALRVQGFGRKTAALFGCVLAAYVVTVLGNGLRIWLSIALRESALLEHFSFVELHRVLGVAVYLVLLWCLYFAAEALLGRVRSGLLRALGLPLVLYIAVTLMVPLLRGAASRPAFGAHAAAVALVSACLLVLAIALFTVARRVRWLGQQRSRLRG